MSFVSQLPHTHARVALASRTPTLARSLAAPEGKRGEKKNGGHRLILTLLSHDTLTLDTLQRGRHKGGGGGGGMRWKKGIRHKACSAPPTNHHPPPT